MIRGIVGINGAGKTTYLRRRVGELERKKVRVGYLPDTPTIPVEVTALELLWRVGVMNGVADAQQKATDLLDFLLIEDFDTQPVAHYSMGNYKKTALALTLLIPAQVMLLDEPLENLDAISRKRAWAMFEQMADRGTEFEISTQDFDIAMACDHITVWADLQVVADGTPRDVLGRDPLRRLLELSQVDPSFRPPSWLGAR